jgi:hypothetical protein
VINIAFLTDYVTFWGRNCNKNEGLKMTDFQALTRKLHDRGWSDQRIAQKLGCVRTAIYQLRIGRNKEPRYNLGRALVELERRTRPRKVA